MFWGNILLPSATLLWAALWLLRKKKAGFYRLLSGLLVCAALNAFAAAGVPALTRLYALPLHGGIFNQYLLFVLADLLFLICGLIYLAGSLIVAWKEKSPEHRYRDENLFFFGQLISKLNTTSKTMTLICIALVLAIFLFIAAPILTGWASGYLDIRSLYDVQIYSRYNDVYEEEALPHDDYEAASDFLAAHGIETAYDCTFSLYLPRKEDFHNGRDTISPWRRYPSAIITRYGKCWAMSRFLCRRRNSQHNGEPLRARKSGTAFWLDTPGS